MYRCRTFRDNVFNLRCIRQSVSSIIPLSAATRAATYCISAAVTAGRWLWSSRCCRTLRNRRARRNGTVSEPMRRSISTIGGNRRNAGWCEGYCCWRERGFIGRPESRLPSWFSCWQDRWAVGGICSRGNGRLTRWIESRSQSWYL